MICSDLMANSESDLNKIKKFVKRMEKITNEDKLGKLSDESESGDNINEALKIIKKYTKKVVKNERKGRNC